MLTLYQITPEEIFSGELDLLNANFFSASSSESSEKLDNFSMTVQYNTVTPDVDDERATLNSEMKSRRIYRRRDKDWRLFRSSWRN